MEGAEDVCIKHRPSVVSVEAFDYAVLCRVARLDIDDERKWRGPPLCTLWVWTPIKIQQEEPRQNDVAFFHPYLIQIVQIRSLR